MALLMEVYTKSPKNHSVLATDLLHLPGKPAGAQSSARFAVLVFFADSCRHSLMDVELKDSEGQTNESTGSLVGVLMLPWK